MQQMKREDAQDHIAVLSAQAGVVKQQLELALCHLRIFLMWMS